MFEEKTIEQVRDKNGSRIKEFTGMEAMEGIREKLKIKLQRNYQRLKKTNSPQRTTRKSNEWRVKSGEF